jgi:hypothetical protein
MTGSAKSFLRLLFIILVIAAGVLYLMVYQQQIAIILGGCLMLFTMGFIFYTNFWPVANYLSERATNVMNVYQDASGNGLHIFSAFIVSRIKSGLCPLRNIQYYFLVPGTRKLYYKILFSHEMETAKGHAGYEDFTSFEEEVLPGEDLRIAMEEFSAKAGWQLQLGDLVPAGEKEEYETKLGECTFRIETKTAAIQDTMQVCCYDDTDTLLWSKKI